MRSGVDDSDGEVDDDDDATTAVGKGAEVHKVDIGVSIDHVHFRRVVRKR